MVNKHSEAKVTKTFQLYFQGDLQTTIANKLKITQASISQHVSKFKQVAEQQGIMAAAEEYGVMDVVEPLYGLAVELKKNHASVEDALSCLKLKTVLDEGNIEEDEYGELIPAVKKVVNEDYLAAAIELSQLVASTGLFPADIVAEYKNTSEELTQAKKELQETKAENIHYKQEAENSKKQMQAAAQDLKAHMHKIGVDENRLKMVEALALALKEADITNLKLADYLQRQQLLNKAGISVDLFVEIIEKAGVVTHQDHGKKLFGQLSEYGNLSDTNKALKLQNEALTKQTAVLKEKAKLQGEIETRIDNLIAEEATLEPKVKDLRNQFETMTMLQNQVAVLEAQKTALELKIGEMQTQIKGLNTDIDTKNKKVSDLKEVESEREAVLKETAELKFKFEHDQRRWDIYQDFLGLVQSTSKHELKTSVQALTVMVESLPENTFAKDLDSLKNSVLQALTENKLPFLLKCQTCGASIATNKIKANGDYQCPSGEPFPASPHEVIFRKPPVALFKEALSPQASLPIVMANPINTRITHTRKPDSKTL